MADVADLYQTLGVSPDADADAIKRAFRKLAKENHPDTHPGDKAAEERFKSVSQAYEILSDPEKRRRYDAMRRSPFGGQGGPQGGGPWRQQAGAGSINDLFEMFFGRGASPFGRGGFGGSPFGFEDEEDEGRDLESEVWASFEDAALGRPLTVHLAGREQPLRLNLPQGAEDGLRLRLSGQGQPGPSGRRGDLYLTLRVRPSAQFRREGQDLLSTLRLNLAQALLGATLTVPTLDGEVRLKVPAGSAPGTRLRLRGKGIRGKEGSGDHLVELALDLPADLDAEEQAQLKAMAAKRGWEL
jgi:DnaJ-class molecular chaperone